MTFADGQSNGTRILRPYIEWLLGMVMAFTLTACISLGLLSKQLAALHSICRHFLFSGSDFGVAFGMTHQ